LTLNGVTGFSQANIGLNLAADNAANFLFSWRKSIFVLLLLL
jgi:hypothetical protein